MDILENLSRLSLVPIVIIFLNVKISGEKHFKIASVSLLFVIFFENFLFRLSRFSNYKDGLSIFSAICFADAF